MQQLQVPEDSFFALIASLGLENLGGNNACTTYKKGQNLFYEGSFPVGVYCIQKGKVKVYKLGQEGKDHIIQISTNGDLLGYRALISEEVYPVSAETLEESSVCFIPKSDFLAMLEKYPKLHHKVLKEACKELRDMTERLTTLAQKTVRERLAVALLNLDEIYNIGRATTETTPPEIQLTREELANIVGTATETLIRLLNTFKADGFISSGRKKVSVLDKKALQRIGKI